MMSVQTGEFETHLTVSPLSGGDEQELERWAAGRGLKYTRILLDRGRHADQPMLTFTASGSLEEQRAAAERYAAELAGLGWPVVRTKIEAAPWNPGVPQTDEEAVANRPDQYFEHHVKLLLDDEDLDRVRGAVARHGAHLSRNARRRRADGRHERFVTQRGYRIGAQEAGRRLDELLAVLADLGVAVLEVEREFVVLDDRLSLDAGWSTPEQTSWRAPDGAGPAGRRVPEAGSAGFPATYQPVTHGEQARQYPVFDPATKQFDNAFRAGEPVFDDPATAARWRLVRRSVREHLLRLVSAAEWADHLVLRGSALMPSWVGGAARDPGDLDWVVVPPSLGVDDPKAAELLDRLVEAVHGSSLTLMGARIDTGDVAVEDIWTYDRVPGRRMLLRWSHPEVPDGTLQLDFVFGEHLPEPPVEALVPTLDGGALHLLGASPQLSLAWKLLWLHDDCYPQGKDLYDAVLLAERYLPSRELVARVLADAEYRFDGLTESLVMGWEVDWAEFVAEYPDVPGDVVSWKRRLVAALRPILD
ncbi:nucleotidyl transferase AbiEii/AbiGii toxin family protein [Thermobifida cellulosilytica]|uniref:Ankyrin n=1 Tax=Thermobifida cellulosilytica TB100 TaxID=665004 RepID=A0A147KJP8_THECS|nr:nucleotidyl transferase AbiEii/AbiGii toxin family protein [Thermobifida cellulosilytica]KUP97518.1 hypothetical protein AC529_06745 [Thermobifida cellulosilytica TB100]